MRKANQTTNLEVDTENEGSLLYKKNGISKRVKVNEESINGHIGADIKSLSTSPPVFNGENPSISPKREEGANLDEDMTTQIGDGMREEGTTSNNN
jgi:hypothetical protein